ncbi:VC0807 family protein [Actinocrispum sp. NPDC049592]|uniref:VC0807 family protein n=1 Tax=Actinocrispum sp. NPDC049592 TaxID=3154835 RepID=UPI00343D1980
MRTALLEIALSIGGYYLLRAFGAGVFWALTAPAIAVAIVALTETVRRHRVDMIGLLVLCELAATLTLSLVTQSALVAALREPVYVLIGGVFCLATLLFRRPFSHVSTAAIATFGDSRRAAAFDHAWREVPRYRMWQRLITASFGLIMVATAVIRADILATASDLAHAIDVSNILGFVMIGAVVVVSAILIQPARKIIEELLERS